MKYDNAYFVNISNTEEVTKNYISCEEAKGILLQDSGVSYIDSPIKPLLIGRSKEKSMLIKICTNIGISSASQLTNELNKIEKLNSLSYKPDILFDHSRKGLVEKPLWRYMLENYNGVIATAPVIACFDEEYGLDRLRFLETVECMAESGVKLMVFHPTATLHLWELAKNRICASTSWNGTLLYRDMQINHRTEPIVSELFDDILCILRKYRVTCDIGTVFRPARVSEALDEVHIAELFQQEKYIQKAKDAGVFTIREGVGHIPVNKVKAFSRLIKHNTPLMPLPVSTDAAIGFDHIACAVSATALGMYTNLGIINPVTRIEHTGGIPSFEIIDEALKTARVVAHSLDISNSTNAIEFDNQISDIRQRQRLCCAGGGLFDYLRDENSQNSCNRCDVQCPLKKST